MFPIFLVQLALFVIAVRSIYAVIKNARTMGWLDIAFHISLAIFTLSILLPHSYSYYIH
jgi:steroid 5-alpha reductase family enzyme